MKNTTKIAARALAFCVAMVVMLIPALAFADMPRLEAGDNPVAMTEGDVATGFAPAGATCESTDPSIAWVDEAGNLNALKVGTTTITVVSESGERVDYAVTVEDYTDGSEVVGRLKLLARYNDSMQFYDGHVYLLFTSYQDGVDISIDDLYGAYEVSDQYYTDIRADIANGSNHTGSDAGKYFTFTDSLKTMTLDRGEIVTIGMYRGFDLTVPQAALGSLKNSSMWASIVNAGKAGIVESLFGFIETGKIQPEEAFAELLAIFKEIGVDYNKWLDGVVEGGVCLNRELYNQKLEWDQFENVTYELDITKNQLDRLVASYNGNLNKFSILKNSCATVALRAWNAAVGTRDGVDTAYKINPGGTGIYALIDAPKSVRDSIVNRLPGYYLNNAQGVAEPDAGFVDETGCVYVSAPEPVNPVVCVYKDEGIQIDTTRSKMAALVNAAKAGSAIVYGIDEQQIDVAVHSSVQDSLTTVSGIDFTINGTTVSLNEKTALANGMWLKVKVDDLAEGATCYVTDAQGNALPSAYADGWVSFRAEALPATYAVVGSTTGTKNVLKTSIVNADEVAATTEVYYRQGGAKVPVDATAELASGTKVFITSRFTAHDFDHILRDITLNGASIMDSAHFDAEEGAYVAIMPEAYSTLEVIYDHAALNVKTKTVLQVSRGDVLDISDYVELLVGDDEASSNATKWSIFVDPNGILAYTDESQKQLEALKPGMAVMWARAQGNDDVSIPFGIEVYESTAEMVKVTYNEENDNLMDLWSTSPDGQEKPVFFSGYLVEKGSTLAIEANPDGNKVISYVSSNGEYIACGQPIVVQEDTDLKVLFKNAAVVDMPKTINLAAKGDSYQLNARVQYTDFIYKYLPVYDKSITYESSDPLVQVDENGLVTVAGDIPEGGKLVSITAYAGSSNDCVSSTSKVVVGDYKGAQIVGQLTISARRSSEKEWIPHAATTFTTYQDVTLDTSFYEFYQPNEKYKSLMEDYRDHPEKYASDPALYNDDLVIEDRESYFNIITNGPESAPFAIELKAGESISVSNYDRSPTNADTVMSAFVNGSMMSSENTQELLRQWMLYHEGKEIDVDLSFDSLVGVLSEMYAVSAATGHNPADGYSEGGIMVNREIFNQFRRDDSQFPNNYYTVEITADELDALRAYMANPDNNFYSFFNKNCASGAIDMWNATLSDRPELQVKGNYSVIMADPESLYVELGLMRSKGGLDGEGGTDFCPRTVAYKTTPEVPATSITKVAGAKKAFKVVWEPQADVTGYQIMYSAKKNFKKASTVTVAKSTATAKKVKNLKENTKYYVKVRTYKTDGSAEYYSDWSDARSVKTK